MKGKVIDKNLTDAFIALENGDTMDVKLSNLPRNVQLGDNVDVPFNSNHSLTNDKLVDFF